MSSPTPSTVLPVGNKPPVRPQTTAAPATIGTAQTPTQGIAAAQQTPVAKSGPENDSLKDANPAKSTEELLANRMTSDQLKPTKEGGVEYDWPACAQKIEQAREQAIKSKGKPGCNPFLWIKENLEPLVNRLNRGETSQKLYDMIMALKVPEKPSSREFGVKALPNPRNKE